MSSAVQIIRRMELGAENSTAKKYYEMFHLTEEPAPPKKFASGLDKKN